MPLDRNVNAHMIDVNSNQPARGHHRGRGRARLAGSLRSAASRGGALDRGHRFTAGPARRVGGSSINRREGARRRREGDVAVPAGETANLIVAKADLAHRPLDALFNRPAAFNGTEHVDQRGDFRGPDGIVGDVGRATEAAAEQDTAPPTTRLRFDERAKARP